METARAFGAGTHPTTQGCLHILAAIAALDNTPRTILDIGTGSGILSIASAKLWPNTTIQATEICEDSVKTAQDQVNNNQCNNRINIFHTQTIDNTAPADLVIANILPVVLKPMAKDICQRTQHTLILSGIIEEERQGIIDLYKQQGMVFINDHIIEGWNTLLFQKPNA